MKEDTTHYFFFFFFFAHIETIQNHTPPPFKVVQSQYPTQAASQ